MSGGISGCHTWGWWGQRGVSICRWLLPLLELQESLWIRQGSGPRINSLQADKRLDCCWGLAVAQAKAENLHCKQ